MKLLRETGRLSLLDPQGGVLLSGQSRVHLTDTTEIWSGKGDALAWEIVAHQSGGSIVRLVLTNTSDFEMSVERMDLLVADEGSMLGEKIEVGRLGWQSWSYTALPAPLPQDHSTWNAEAPKLNPMLPVTDAERLILPWMTVIHEPTSEQGVLLGFISAKTQLGVFTLQETRTGHRLVASSVAEGKVVKPGEKLFSEPLLILHEAARSYDLLHAYGAALGDSMQASAARPIPTGWCSWYEFFTNTTEADMIRNLEFISENDLPLRYVQIDDAYQTHIGDWLTIKETFPHGMKWLADEIKSKGYEPGIWLAPFIVGADSDVYRDHPDWVLRDLQGVPVNALDNWGTRCYCLDLTHPEVLGWLEKVFSTVVQDWGYTYLKLDFLYAGAARGVRYDASQTGIQAYRAGMELIRRLAGDAYILGCGAPYLPSVGVVDGMRVDPDIGLHWVDPKDPFGTEPATRSAIRTAMSVGWMHRVLWNNDVDPVLLRDHHIGLNQVERLTLAAVVAMSGGAAFLTDDLPKLEPEGAALIPRLIHPTGKAAEPFGPINRHGLPAGMKLQGPKGVAVALFNWADDVQSLQLSEPIARELAGMSLHDAWTGAKLGEASTAQCWSTPPHGHKLILALDANAVVDCAAPLLDAIFGEAEGKGAPASSPRA